MEAASYLYVSSLSLLLPPSLPPSLPLPSLPRKLKVEPMAVVWTPCDLRRLLIRRVASSYVA